MKEIPYSFTLIGQRGAMLGLRYGKKYNPMEIAVTVHSCHEVIPLRIQELMDADDGNFAHDVFGIMRHWAYAPDGKGHLTDCFLPRFADLTEKKND